MLDDRLLDGSSAAGALADRPPLPSGPLPDERFDPFRPYRGGPLLSYTDGTGTAASPRAPGIDGARLVRVAAPDVPPLPAMAAVRSSGPDASPFYADQVADALARHVTLADASTHDEPGAAHAASRGRGDVSSGGLTRAPFYADQVAYARMHVLPVEMPTRAAAGAADVVAPFASPFSFAISELALRASPDSVSSMQDGEVARHASFAGHIAFAEPHSTTAGLDRRNSPVPAWTTAGLVSGSVAAVVRDRVWSAEAAIGDTDFARQWSPSIRVAEPTRQLVGGRPIAQLAPVSIDELAAQVAGIGGDRPPSTADRAPASRRPHVAMRVRTHAVSHADSHDRSPLVRAVHAKPDGRISERLSAVAIDAHVTQPYDAHPTSRANTLSEMPSATEIAAALVAPKAGGLASAASQKPYRTAHDAMLATADARRDVDWRLTAETKVGLDRDNRTYRSVVHENIMAPVAAAQHRAITLDMPQPRAYRDVVTSVAVVASNGPSFDIDRKRAPTIGYVF